MTPEHAPTVLLTRSAEDNAQTAAVFGAAGLATASLPGIMIDDPESWSATDEAIRTFEAYDGILFTSRNSAERFLMRFDALRPTERHLFEHVIIAAVGQKTRDALTGSDLRVDIAPDQGSAEALLALVDDLGPRGKRFLFPASDIARDLIPKELRKRGAVVDEICVYRTIAPDASSLDPICSALSDGTIACIAFFSPSAVRNVIELLGAACLEKTHLAAIGPTTASALAKIGRRADIIPERPHAEDLAAAIMDYFTATHTKRP